MSPLDPSLLDSLKEVFKGPIITPGDGDIYKKAISRWAENAILPAHLVTHPRTALEVSAIISWSREHSIAIATKGGGHDLEKCTIENGSLIGLSVFMNTVSIEEKSKQIKVQGGALWKDVHSECLEKGKGVSVVCAGVSSVGGHGWQGGEHGLIGDNILSCEIVLSNGEILQVNQNHHPDLLWALKGWGKNFGVVTEITLQGHEQKADVYVAEIHVRPEGFDSVIAVLEEVVRDLPDKAAVFMFIEIGEDGLGMKIVAYCNGTEKEGEEVFKRLLESPDCIQSRTGMRSLKELLCLADDKYPSGLRDMASILTMKNVDGSMLRKTLKFLASEPPKIGDIKSITLTVQWVPRRVISRYTTDDASYLRHGPDIYDVFLESSWHNAESDNLFAELHRNYVDTISKASLEVQSSAVDAQQAEQRKNAVIARLRKIKAKYDEFGMFTKDDKLVKCWQEKMIFD